MKKLIAIYLISLLFSCKNKTYHDLKTGEMTGPQVLEIMGRPDAVETGKETDAKVEYWHYYDLALDLHFTNDTLRVIIEVSGMETLNPKMDEVLNH
jgi:hypothetical protein